MVVYEVKTLDQLKKVGTFLSKIPDFPTTICLTRQMESQNIRSIIAYLKWLKENVSRLHIFATEDSRGKIRLVTFLERRGPPEQPNEELKATHIRHFFSFEDPKAISYILEFAMTVGRSLFQKYGITVWETWVTPDFLKLAQKVVDTFKTKPFAEIERREDETLGTIILIRHDFSSFLR